MDKITFTEDDFLKVVESLSKNKEKTNNVYFKIKKYNQSIRQSFYQKILSEIFSEQMKLSGDIVIKRKKKNDGKSIYWKNPDIHLTRIEIGNEFKEEHNLFNYKTYIYSGTLRNSSVKNLTTAVSF